MLSKKEKIKFVILRTIGNFLFLFALFGMAMTFGPAGWEEVQYRWDIFRNVHYVVADVKAPAPNVTPLLQPQISPTTRQTFFGQLTGGDKVEALVPVDPNFSIVIPKIGANARVIANVDAGNPDEYLPALKEGVAHALGTTLPGSGGNIYMFAHSTDNFWDISRYNAIFFLLKNLEKGDEVDVFFSRVRHKYRVVDKKIVDPSDVKYLTEKTPYEQLTLQTCWPPGTTLDRLIVIARPESDLR